MFGGGVGMANSEVVSKDFFSLSLVINFTETWVKKMCSVCLVSVTLGLWKFGLIAIDVCQ